MNISDRVRICTLLNFDLSIFRIVHEILADRIELRRTKISEILKNTNVLYFVNCIKHK